MKKNYILLVFLLLLSFSSFGQIVANDRTICNSPMTLFNLIQDVTLNGVTPSISQVNFTQISTSNPGIYLDGNLGFGYHPFDFGSYSLTYQVCEAANPTNCTTAVFTVNNYAQPSVSVIQPDCISFYGEVIIFGLPTSGWTITNIGLNGEVVQGNSSEWFSTFLNPGQYVFNVTATSGCQFDPIFVTIEPAMLTSPPTVVSQTCASPIDSITLNDLPATGTWTIGYNVNSGPTVFISGTGTSYTITGLTPNYYYFNVTSDLGCIPTQVGASVGYINDGISGTLTAAYVDYNADGITNLGDIIQYTVAITNNLTCSMETVTYEIQNAPNTSGTLSNLGAGQTANGILNYAITQNDINNGSVFNWVALNGYANGYNSYAKIYNQSQTVVLTLSDGIQLNAFFDTNNNGIQNNGELNVDLGNFTYQLNNNGIIHNLYSQNGTNIIYESSPTNTYNLSYNLYNNCTGQYNVSNTSYNNITVPIGSGITTYNFPITQSPCQDVQIYLYSASAVRPGFNYLTYLYYKNIGNQTLASGSITFTKDNALTITTISEASATTTATGFTYNFTNLLPGETRSIAVNMLVPTIPTVALGQLVNTSASITIPINDINPNNNNSALTQIISGSYDPNDKTESHGGKIVHSSFTANDYLTYMIRFENTGTASAINIRVNDILDEKLDETSLKMVRASHPYVLDRVGTNLTWRFDGVNLPPSVPNDAVTGHGYIVFQVKPKPGFTLGDIIPNTADIYFDFNPAIVTNTCITEFVPFLGVNVFDDRNFEFYPNPTSDTVTFAMKNTATIDTIEVIDVLGKILISKTVHFNNAEIDFSSLKQGMYLVKLSANGQTKTVKITKS